MDIVGGYQWMARLSDGREVREFESEDSPRLSVDALRDEGVLQGARVVEIHMVPGYIEFPYVIMDVAEGEEFIKHWGQEVVIGLGEEPTQSPTVDVLGLLPRHHGTHRRPTRLFIYPPGSMHSQFTVVRLTSSREQ